MHVLHISCDARMIALRSKKEATVPFDGNAEDWEEKPEYSVQRFGAQIALTICALILLLPFAFMFVTPVWPP